MAHEIPIKVRFSETDALGHISNISYFIYLEEARTDFFAELGFGHDINNWKIILASASCDFISQGHYNQRLMVRTEVSKIGNSSFQVVHEIKGQKSGELIAKGQASAVHFDFKTQKSEALPEANREHLEKHLIREASHYEN
ncbi:thioesterase superfamily protein [Planococcus antarcticus DSM 14505]|uniref:Thioesterase n=1 Tax=Planococcus antarcticus DSM 14505 TaxID=1185653 RepID=A0A1C7DC12_9BACL|nr:thioesterase family protein [Planococcus antarcticus]ANU09026.1 thioesterase [Planococcus antarcticus DSM 14505]EIM07276.1 thioesterase superfamily protein [Planococcus antarcticus DSM 14505]